MKSSRLEQLSRICLALPETVRDVKGDHAIFRVRNKVFAYFLNNHHGDGIVSVCCRCAPGENLDRIRHEPERFYLPADIGPRGWFGLRLDHGVIVWDEVAAIVQQSYCLAAPPTLVQQLEQQSS